MKRVQAGLKLVFARLGMYLAILGPGLITASADNDAPGIATYSMAGSTYGYRFLWLLLVITVGEVVVQETAGRMGAVTGKGTADLIRERFGVKITAFAMFCLLLANLGTTVAEFAGVAAATELFGLSRYITVPLAAALVGFVVLRGSYEHVEKVLLVLCLSALSYVISAFMIKPPWGEVLRQAVVPSIQFDTNFILAVLATIGTTITPWGIIYMQASVADKGVDLQKYRLTRMDVTVGAVWGNVVSAFIIICTAATLYVVGISVETAEQAAMALEPLAGVGARYLFAIGLLGASLLAASVLPLSTSYAVCEAFGWERGLNQRPRDAAVFYGLYIGIIVLSVLTVLIPGIPLFPLMWLSQSMNAILLPVLLVLVIKLVNDRRIMGEWVNSRFQNIFSWALAIIILLITVVLFISPLLGMQAPG
ncbi:MAG TPA: divalent metal cation transporter [Anaerolineae bacterium]|nr:divalent metal cation transporter [Anaerolineae bacterium]HOS80664.1 divalent metal cation transporter [Anaerolineae bacterium]HQJ12312.1 divalent metal cation transporter [Anaerolineae bacterium]HQM14988.1 divalent metal cation transporter [Anaerolineae bacterium]